MSAHSGLKLLLLLCGPVDCDCLRRLLLLDLLWLLLLLLELCLLEGVCTRLNGVLLLRCISKSLFLRELLGFSNYLLLGLIGSYILCDYFPPVRDGSGVLNNGFT